MCPLIGSILTAIVLRLGALHPIPDDSTPRPIVARPTAHP